VAEKNSTPQKKPVKLELLEEVQPEDSQERKLSVQEPEREG
jgi:hypothetical protein